ncbi:MAG: aspartate--ammonia ligase [Bacteroidota bacterium]|nr:aspartate--ammonia ligase [Bacteroidota bacterium]
MNGIYFPENYSPLLGLNKTEQAIKLIKDFFQTDFASELRLRRVTAPLFVLKGTGINDDLNGVERPVAFAIKDMNDANAEIVHSLAKWKRLKLADYGMKPGFGLYTDMNAVRPDEVLDNLHSIYVDQWDWERVITPGEHNLDFLKLVVRRIFGSFKRTEFFISENYPEIKPSLPDQITFIQSEDLLKMYPNLSPKEREDKIAEKYGAVFIMGIGGELSDGKIHDGRAPDYDDWSTETGNGYKGLNGDILFWNPILKGAFEVSSMGIRVDREAMLRQLAIAETEDRKELYFHRRLLNNELPLSIGGGIGQSRLCMFFLKKAHIGEIQSSIWPEKMVQEFEKHNVILL